jgi:type I restriction enzyme, S subunit
MARNNIYPPSVTPGIPNLGKKPDGWIETTFGKVLKPVQRKAKLVDNQEYQLVVARRNRGGVAPRSNLKGREIKTKTQFYLRANDFLIAKRQIIHGACGVVPKELDGSIVSNEYSVLNVKDGLLLDYLNYYCHTVHFQQTCFQSSIGVDVEKMVFKLDQWLGWKIHLPPLPEQRKIVDILSTWDEAIAKTEQLIAVLQKRKKGLMQRLLTGEVRFQEFGASKTHPNRDFPPDWKIMELGSFVSKVNSKVNPSLSKAVFRCVELEHLSQETGKIFGYTTSDQQKSIKNAFKAGQVLFGKLRPYLRKYAYTEFDGVCSSEIWVLNGKKTLCNNLYLFYLVQTDRFTSVANVTSGTKMPRADWEYVSEAIFGLPSIPEQVRIAAVLKDCDIEITLHSQKLDALKQQKKGLMQRLLTGQVRVKADRGGK